MKANTRWTHVARLVAKARRAKGLSLRELGSKAQLSQTAVQQVERGRGSVDAALAVMVALGLPQKVRVSTVVSDMVRIARAA